MKSATILGDFRIPDKLLGAAWGPHKARMEHGIYFPLFLVLYRDARNFAIYYLPADLQTPSMFEERAPLSNTARRAGWQGFYYRFRGREHLFAKLYPMP